VFASKFTYRHKYYKSSISIEMGCDLDESKVSARIPTKEIMFFLLLKVKIDYKVRPASCGVGKGAAIKRH
jgi:hypothetical protein